MSVGRIYKITNKINNKIYIGQTIKSLDERFKRHLLVCRLGNHNNIKLYNAIRKYGKENFQIEEIEKTSQDKLDERERFWIKKLDTFNNGYNSTLGGEGFVLNDYNEIYKTYLETLSLEQTSKICGCCVNTVRDVLNSFNYKIPKRLTGNAKQPISIKQIDKNSNNIIKQFNSLSDAVRWLIENNKTTNKCASSELAKCARGKRNEAYGYKWQF